MRRGRDRRDVGLVRVGGLLEALAHGRIRDVLHVEELVAVVLGEGRKEGAEEGADGRERES